VFQHRYQKPPGIFGKPGYPAGCGGRHRKLILIHRDVNADSNDGSGPSRMLDTLAEDAAHLATVDQDIVGPLELHPLGFTGHPADSGMHSHARQQRKPPPLRGPRPGLEQQREGQAGTGGSHPAAVQASTAGPLIQRRDNEAFRFPSPGFGRHIGVGGSSVIQPPHLTPHIHGHAGHLRGSTDGKGRRGSPAHPCQRTLS